MENVTSKAFGADGDRDWTIMFFFFSRSAGVNASLHLYDDFKTKKIVVLEYKYNIMLTILFNINS